MSYQLVLLGAGAGLGLIAGVLTVAIGGRQLESRGLVLLGAIAAGLTMALCILAFGLWIDLGLDDAGPIPPD